MSFNQVTLLGNLTKNPETKYLKDGLAVCNFSIAVNYKLSGKEEVDFFDITSFDRIAETCQQFLIKGSKVLVNGRLKQSRWKDEQGRPKSKVYINAVTVHFLNNKTDQNSQNEVPF